ncbi:MAG: alpha-galactosidase [Erysipelotrichaceae bacterium]|nr:alpha-galactosidase [Erysipelotrichaceae bacterium]
MIQVENGVFLLSTKDTSYMFRIGKYGHLEHLHYGRCCSIADAEAFAYKKYVSHGDSIVYDKDDDVYSMDSLPQEYGTYGSGDFNEASIEIENDGSYTLDLHYAGHEITNRDLKMHGLPSSYGSDETLIVHLKDETAGIGIDLYYTLYLNEDVIARRAVIFNRNGHSVTLHKALSYCIDLRENDLVSMGLFGAWDQETHLHEQKVGRGTYVISSSVGFSSSKNDPGIILRKESCDEGHGSAWGFNLVYSGNHYTSLSHNEYGFTRMQGGISPERFSWTLNAGAFFETPEAVMTFSCEGLNRLSQNLHSFINGHIVTSAWKNKERPILINSWEGFGFDFHKDELIEKLVKPAKELGIELFVLDDGWFGRRDCDRRGLGDYDCNLNKIPGGIASLSKEVHDAGMLFGIWVEPEAINPDSALYEAHPDYALKEEGRDFRFGRHELLMDLTKKEVADYIVENVSKLIDENKVDYIKWDMNRMMNAVSGAYNHRYILALYDILDRIFTPRPQVLFESCSSGGNRFDLGMLCYSPQVWSSDDTDPIERLDIQKGLSYFYPLSSMGAHVSACPHSQTLRRTPLATRFSVSAFGCLGYELDLSKLTTLEKQEIKEQIAWYKKHRKTFQYGTFYRIDKEKDFDVFEVKDKGTLVCKFRRQLSAVPVYDRLFVEELLPDKMYSITSHSFILDQKDLGRHVSPYEGSQDEFLKKEGGFRSYVQNYEASGAALQDGIALDPLYLGTGYEKHIRIPLDNGCDMYLIDEIKD